MRLRSFVVTIRGGAARRRLSSTFPAPPTWSVRAPTSSSSSSESAVTEEQLERLGQLSALPTPPDLKADVLAIVRYCAEIHPVDTSGVEPMLSPLEAEPMPMRDDVPDACVPDPLANAPHTDRGFLVAPKVVDLEDS